MKKMILILTTLLLCSCSPNYNSLYNNKYVYEDEKIRSVILLKETTLYYKYYNIDFAGEQASNPHYFAYKVISVDDNYIYTKDNYALCSLRIENNFWEIALNNEGEGKELRRHKLAK